MRVNGAVRRKQAFREHLQLPNPELIGYQVGTEYSRIRYQPMTSNRFTAELRPEPLLRKIVLLSGCAGLLIGMALLMRLPVHWFARLVLCILWSGAALREIGSFSRGMQRTQAIIVTPTGVAIVNRHGRQEAAQIMSGSVVLPRLAWLRLKLQDGLSYAEFLRGDPARSRQWRHLQILWQHGTGTFGGRG